MSIPTNHDRASWARSALDGYILGKGETIVPDDIETDITDILADLRHLCDEHGLDFHELDQRASGHYALEHDEGGQP